MMVDTLTPALGRQWQADFCKSEVDLAYLHTVSSRPDRATQ